jgi:argininosuccinate synthase
MKTAQTNPFMDTHGKIMPYYFSRLENGKIKIAMLRGPIVIVSREEAERLLQREDLNMQKKKMYQAVLSWDKNNQVQQ